MPRRFAIVLLAAAATAAVFILPAQAAGKSTHVAVRTSVRAVHAPKARGAAPQAPTVAWTSGATMPVAVEETGGGAGAGSSFYVPGGYKNFSCGTGTCLNDTVQKYVKTSNTWTNDTANPIPPVTGLQPGLADAAVCYDPTGKKVHIIDGVAYDSAGNGFIIAEHLVYDPAAPTGRMTYLSLPVDSLGNVWFGQDQGCAFIGGKMYLFGGYGVIGGNPAQIENATWVYDPATDTWSDTGKLMQHPRLWMGYTANASLAFAAGGTDNIFTFVPLASTERFSPSGGWVATANLPKALLAPGEGLVGTHLVVWGGGDSSFITQNKDYHCNLPACSAFTTLAFNLPSSKWFSAFGAGSSMFNGGGDTGSGIPTNTSEHLP
jgi:Galactose oxidase, central domain